MKHRLGVTVGVVLLGIGVAPFWMGKPGKASHPASDAMTVSSSGARSLLVASATDDYIPPLLGYADDELIDNPRLNPMLALTGADADDEPGRLTFLAEYLPRLPVAPSLLLVGGYDAPRLTPFPNPGMSSGGLSLFGGNGIDPTAGPSLDNSNHAVNNQARPDLGYAPAAPTSINPAAPLTYPRPSPGLAQPMPNPLPSAQGNYPAQAGQNPPAAFPNPAGPGAAAPPAGYAAPAPPYGGPVPYPMGQPEMLAYAGAEYGRGGMAPPMAGYAQGAAPFANPGYPPAGFAPQPGYGNQPQPGYGYGAQPGYGYGANCASCQNGAGFAGHGNGYYGANFGGYSQYPGMGGGGQAGYGGHFGHEMGAGFGGFNGGYSPTSYSMGSMGGYESGFGGCCSPSLGCCPPSPSCCMPVSCCGPEMGSYSMNCGTSCCPPMESYGCCPPSGCCGQKRGLFGRLKDWFKGGSRCCNDYDGCYEQPRGGLFCRLKNIFRKKKDGCCYPAPVYACGDPCGGYGGCCNSGFDGGCAGGFSGGYPGGFGH